MTIFLRAKRTIFTQSIAVIHTWFTCSHLPYITDHCKSFGHSMLQKPWIKFKVIENGIMLSSLVVTISMLQLTKISSNFWKLTYKFFSLSHNHSAVLVVGWLLNVPATCECISGTDLLRKFYVLPHWDRSCRSNSLTWYPLNNSHVKLNRYKSTPNYIWINWEFNDTMCAEVLSLLQPYDLKCVNKTGIN